MVALDVREDGNPVTLDELSERISSGEQIGTLTVNGQAVTTDRILALQQAQSALEIIRLLSEDVEITDAHVENFKRLVAGISDGSINLETAAQTGSVKLDGGDVQRTSAPVSPQRVSPKRAPAESELPETKAGESVIGADAEGKYQAPYIDGADYQMDHTFQLSDPSDHSCFMDSQYNGIETDGIVELSCADTASAGTEFRVTAKLKKEQVLPVSFDYSIVNAALGLNQKGTIKWGVGDVVDKTITVDIPAKASCGLWEGSRGFVVNVSNVQNALLEDDKTAWSKTVKVSASDHGTIIKNVDFGDFWSSSGSYNSFINGGSYLIENNVTISKGDDLQLQVVSNSAALPAGGVTFGIGNTAQRPPDGSVRHLRPIFSVILHSSS